MNAGRGPVTVTLPSGYVSGTPTPLIMGLHGFMNDSDDMANFLPFGALAEAYGVITVFPDGVEDLFGFQYWNATDACCSIFGPPVDDVSYLLGLLDLIEAQASVDARRTWLVGFSNGGFMSYRLACEAAGRFAAVVSFAGGTFKDEALCDPDVPVHTLQIHGTADNVIFYGGGAIVGQPTYLGALETTNTWAVYDGCALVPDFSQPALDLASNLAGAETTVRRYIQGCLPGGSAELWTVSGGAHNFPKTSAVGPLVMDWLFDHPKPGGFEDLGFALAGTHGPPLLTGTGTLVGGQPVDITLTNALENTTVWLTVGVTTLFLPINGGTLVPSIDPPGLALPFLSDGTGSLTLAGPWPLGVPSGFEFWVQEWVVDPAGPFGFAASNALKGTTP